MRTLTLFAKIMGTEHAEAIVFLPGFIGSHSMWNSDFQALSTRYKLILIDTLGFGNSPKPDIDYSLADHLDAINNTLQSLNIHTAHIVGHSMGCLLALAYAHQYAESIKNIVLLALPCYQDEQEAREQIKNSSLFNRWLAMDTPLAHVACEMMCRLRPLLMAVTPMFAHDVPAVVAKDALRHTWTSYSRTLQHVIFEARAEEWLRGMSHPILIIQGKHDRVAPLDRVEQAIDHLPHIKLIALEAGHRLVFTHSAVITAEIAQFLQDGEQPYSS